MLEVQILKFDKSKGEWGEWVVCEKQELEQISILNLIQEYDWKAQIEAISEQLKKQDSSYTPPDIIQIRNTDSLALWITSWDESIYTVSAGNDSLPDNDPNAWLGEKEFETLDLLAEAIIFLSANDIQSLKALLEETGDKIGKNAQIKEAQWRQMNEEVEKLLVSNKHLMFKIYLGIWLVPFAMMITSRLIRGDLTLISFFEALAISLFLVATIYISMRLQMHFTKKGKS